MSSLLALDGVTKRYVRGGRRGRERFALRDVSLHVHEGEIVAVWGQRRSGRSTLLRVAAGMTAPTEGSVRFAGQDLQALNVLGIRGGIGYCQREFSSVIADTVIEHVAAPLLGVGVSVLNAETRADALLRRVGAAACAEMEPDELDHSELIRVGIARALITMPRLLLVDDPTDGLPPTPQGEGALLALLHSIAHEDGIAVLMTVEDAAALAGVDRALTIDEGELRGERFASREPAPVVALDARRAKPSG